MCDYGFTEGSDWVSANFGNNPSEQGGRPREDHIITLDMAKELCMIQRTDKGKQASLYFIECEKKQEEDITSPSTFSAVETFNFRDYEVRTILVDGEPWFVLADLCKVLDLGNAAAVKRRLDDADKGLTRINTPGGDQNVGIVNESGMYDVVLRSDKPQAKELRRWITSVAGCGLSPDSGRNL